MIGAAPATPDQAEAAFYAAFQSGDAEAMAAIWAPTDDVICIHPRGPQLLGHQQVLQSWQEILASTDGFRITTRLIHHHTDHRTSIRFVNEILYTENDPAQPVTVMATNAYRKTQSGWRMVLHHASPAPAAADDTAEEPPSEQDNVTLH